MREGGPAAKSEMRGHPDYLFIHIESHLVTSQRSQGKKEAERGSAERGSAAPFSAEGRLLGLGTYRILKELVGARIVGSSRHDGWHSWVLCIPSSEAEEKIHFRMPVYHLKGPPAWRQRTATSTSM